MFDDLAHRIVHQTTLSLLAASSALLSRKVLKDSPTPTPADAQLFLLKQLLILKQQIVAYDFEFVNAPDIDLSFSLPPTAVYSGSMFNPATLFRRAGNLLPRVVENMLDAKAELDVRLRECITSLTRAFAASITAPLATARKNKKGSPVTPADAQTAILATRQNVEKEVPGVRRKLSEYLEEARTVETLVGAVEDVVVQEYEDFYAACMVGRPVMGRKGKGREDEVWDPDTFADFTGNVFGVVRFGFGGEDMGFEDQEEMERGERGRSHTGSL